MLESVSYMAESLATLLDDNHELGSNGNSYSLLEKGYFDTFLKSIAGYLVPADGSFSETFGEVKERLTATLAKIIAIEADEELGFKTLIRCIDYETLMKFISSNMVEALDEKNMQLNVDTFGILGFISGLDDAQYMTKMCCGLDEEEITIIDHIARKLQESIWMLQDPLLSA